MVNPTLHKNEQTYQDEITKGYEKAWQISSAQLESATPSR